MKTGLFAPRVRTPSQRQRLVKRFIVCAGRRRSAVPKGHWRQRVGREILNAACAPVETEAQVDAMLALIFTFRMLDDATANHMPQYREWRMPTQESEK